MNNNEVVLDFGHGGTDPGACSGSYKEKVWNKETGDACHQELKRHNVVVHLTRKNDETLSISQRCAIANKTNAKWFVSIHHNAGGGDRGEAIHSIYRGAGKDLADNIGKELKTIGQSAIKVYDRKNGNTDYYGVIRGTNMNAVIVEVCFIDNVEDRRIADTLEERKRNGVAIAHAILKTMGIAIKPTGGSTSSSSHKYKNGNYDRKARVVGTNGTDLNVRKGRGASFDKIGKFNEGQVIEVNYCKDNWFSTWSYKGKEGYISGDYIELI